MGCKHYVTLGVILLFFSTNIYPFTVAERRLKQAYHGLGFTKREASQMSCQIKPLLKRGCDSRSKKIDPVVVYDVLRTGLLLPLSERGAAQLGRQVSVFLEELNQKKIKWRKKVLDTHAWVCTMLATMLKIYDRFSFHYVYDMISSSQGHHIPSAVISLARAGELFVLEPRMCAEVGDVDDLADIFDGFRPFDDAGPAGLTNRFVLLLDGV